MIPGGGLGSALLPQTTQVPSLEPPRVTGCNFAAVLVVLVAEGSGACGRLVLDAVRCGREPRAAGSGPADVGGARPATRCRLGESGASRQRRP
jgi:hypothetical protein